MKRHSGSRATGRRAEVVWTVGHSARAIEEFLGLLQAHAITQVADVRKMPGSRKNPQFDQDALRRKLRGAGIDYAYLPALGGLRRRQKDSPNGGWRNASFRAYADYMLTPEFEAGLAQLLSLAEEKRVALLCAEAVPWRCHRSLIADALVVRGLAVEHILSPTRSQPHSLHDWAHVEGTRITYPATDTHP